MNRGNRHLDRSIGGCGTGLGRTNRRRCVGLFVCVAIAPILPATGAGAAADEHGDRGVTAAGVSAACCGAEGGLELASRFVWRGQPLTGAPVVQPWLTVELGHWYAEAAASLALDESWFERDLGAGRTIRLLGGEIAVGGTGFFFGEDRAGFRSPIVEAGIAWSGSPALPVGFAIARNVVNDPDGSAYGEISIHPSWRDTSADIFAGVASAGSAYYETDGDPGLHLGVAVYRSFDLSGLSAIDIGLTGIAGTEARRAWLVASIGIRAPAHPASLAGWRAAEDAFQWTGGSHGTLTTAPGPARAAHRHARVRLR